MPAHRVAPVLAGALLLSVAGNAYLLSTRTGPRAARPAVAPSPPPPSPSSPPPAAPATPAAPPPPPSPPAPVTKLPTSCTDQLDDLAARLTSAQREVDKRLSYEERYDRTSRSPATETRVAPFLASVFDGAPASLGHDLECHGDTCRLTIVEGEDRDFDWQGRLQGDPAGWQLIGGMSFAAGAPAQDPVSKEPVHTQLVHFVLQQPGAVSGLDVLGAMTASYLGSPEVAGCKARFPTPGHLSVRLDLDSTASTIAIAAGGTLAVEPAGTCLLDELRRRTTATAAQLPPGTLGAVQFFTVEVP